MKRVKKAESCVIVGGNVQKTGQNGKKVKTVEDRKK